jgi:gas vesicle protein
MKNSGKIIIALGTGVALGAALGILFAPAKGSETRNKISSKAHDLKEKVKEVKDAVANKFKVAEDGRPSEKYQAGAERRTTGV